MTDRELLELAAKACCLVHVDYSGVDYDGRWGIMLVDGIGRRTQNWDPLNNDGDAMRTAVACSLGVSIVNNSERTDVVTFLPNQALIGVCEWHENDRSSATRRAIVRAAAEIGRTMTTESVR